MISRDRGRPSKLTPEVVKKLCAAMRLGVAYHTAAIAAGISPRIFATWRRRAEEAADVLPSDWRTYPIGKLKELAAKLDLDETDMKLSHKGDPHRRDWLMLIEEQEGRFQRLFESLEEARVAGEVANLRRVEEGAQGGRIIRKIKTKEILDAEGKVLKSTRETVEYAADMSTRDSKWLLARIHGYERGSDKGQEKSPRERAAEIAAAVRKMQESIGMGMPAPPEID